MRLALTMRVVQAVGYDEPRDAVSHDWIKWLQQLGHEAVLVPNALSSPQFAIEDMGIDGLILSGGNDLIARPGASDETSELRTQTENALLKSAIDKGLPVFATCRGLHVVNTFFGGTIQPQLDTAAAHVAKEHEVALSEQFAHLAGSDTIITNSYHNQGLALNELAEPLHAFATCGDDGVIEGVVHPDLPILAIQWHPERANPAAEFDSAIFNNLLINGAFWKGAE